MSKRRFLAPLLTLLVWSLIFFGWGLDDLSGFFAHPARLGAFVFALLATAFLLMSQADVDPFRTGARPVGRQRWLLALFTAIVMFLAWFLAHADRRGVLVVANGDWLRYLGLALNAGGATIRLMGLRALGKQFSGYVTLQQDHQLVETGIYSLIRHPMYLGGLLAFPGWALVFRSRLAIPLAVLMGVFVAVRVVQEEKLLAERFGAEFEAYRRRTWRLLPYLY